METVRALPGNVRARFGNVHASPGTVRARFGNGTAPEWTHIVQERLAELLKAYENWYAAHAPCLKPHTDAETKTRNERKAAVTRIMRAFVQQFLMFPPVTDADRINMKLPVRDKTHTLIPRPAKPPVFVLRPKSNRSIQIDFRAEEGGGRAKPYGYAGVVVNYALLERPPADYRELTEHKFVTSTPYTIEFTESDRGKRLYVALFWQNTKGGEGPWSDIQMTIVP